MFKKIMITISILIFLGTTLFFYLYILKNNNNSNPNNLLSNFSKYSNDTIHSLEEIDLEGCSYNGWLSTKNGVIVNQKNKAFQLRGVSSHSLDWFYNVITFENLKYLKETWNINVFRIAIYTDIAEKGYIKSPNETKEKVYTIIDAAINLDMYVIVDWHILNDNSPQIYKKEAIEFFSEISQKYGNKPNIIYEICNEPNGSNVKWDSDVKPYAEELIPVIRKNCNKSLIIVGTPEWCTDLTSVINSPLKYDNVLYSCHFYSGTHGSDLRYKILDCLTSNIPIIISECGVTAASGNGDVFFDSFNEWIKFLNSHNISWIYWSFSDKAESSSIISSNYQNIDEKNSLSNFESNSKNIDNYLTNSGSFIKNIFQNYNK